MQNRTLFIGLTGGIGSGKSTVTAYLRSKGYPVIDADQIAREIVEPGMPALVEIVEIFGEGYLTSEGALDRKALGAHVFGQDAELEKLNAIMHRRIDEAIMARFNTLKELHPIVFADIPLLIESGKQERYDEIWLVYIPLDLQIQRVMIRDGVEATFARQQIAAQMPLEAKKDVVTHIIYNTDSLTVLHEQIDNLLLRFEKTSFII